MPTLELDVESAVSSPEPLLQLREVIQGAVAAGVQREEIYAALDQLRLRYRAQGRELEEDLVMDVMDLFHGWAHSTLQI